MGASKEQFMQERIKAEMYMEDYLTLDVEQRELLDIKAIDVPEFDYSEDELWNELKAKSNKAYKDLKKREYELRNK